MNKHAHITPDINEYKHFWMKLLFTKLFASEHRARSSQFSFQFDDHPETNRNY